MNLFEVVSLRFSLNVSFQDVIERYIDCLVYFLGIHAHLTLLKR